MLRLCLATVLCLGVNGFAWSAKKTDVAHDNLNDVHQKIETLKKELDASQDAHKDAADALKASETAISRAQKKLHDIHQTQQQKRLALDKLNQQSMQVNAKLAEQQQRLGQQLNQQYRQGVPSYTQFALEHQDPNTLARELKYYSYIAKARAELISEMQENLKQIQTLNHETATTLQQVAALKAKQEAEKRALEQQKQEKAHVVKSLSQQIAAQRNQISKLKRDERDLLRLVERIAKQAARRETAKKQASPQDTQAKKRANNPAWQENSVDKHNAAPTVVAKNEQLPDSDSQGLSFASKKGQLRLPVKGEVSNRFGSARADTGMQWKGLFIRATEGSEVRSIADGRVVFADWMRGFGNLIIIDHGRGFMSLYGNNQALMKNVGDAVNSGDKIAAVGNSGGSEVDGLYYELRRNSVPFDPLSWSRLR